MAQLFGPEHHGLAPGHSNFGRDGWMAHKNMWLLIHPQPRSAVMLAIFTVLPFLYVVPMCLPRVELVPCRIFKNPGSVLCGNCWGEPGWVCGEDFLRKSWGSSLGFLNHLLSFASLSTDVTGIQLPEYPEDPEGKRCRAKMLL